MPFIYLLAMDMDLEDSFIRSFHRIDNIEIVRDDLFSFLDSNPSVTGIVSPANSFGMMSGGLDKALRDYFGMELQDAVRGKIRAEWFGEQNVGTCMVVDIPNTNGKKLFHTPSMRTPSVIKDYQVIYTCMRSVLIAALEADVKSLLVPAFGAGTGHVPVTIVAENMRLAYDQIRDQLENPHNDTFRTALKIY